VPDTPKQPDPTAVELDAKIIPASVDTAAGMSSRSKWLVGLVMTVIGSLAVPAATAFQQYASTKATEETATAKRKADALASQRAMQADLLKRIIAVAERATLKDPTSVFQLGLIAGMVNENRDDFGIELKEAEQTMKRMYDSLAPIAGLRRRIAESNRVLAWLQRHVKTTDQQQEKVRKQIIQLRKQLATKLPRWQRERLQQALREHQSHRSQYRLEHLFYEQQIKREQLLKHYFTTALLRQETALKQRLQQTTALRKRLKQRTERFAYLVTALKMQVKVPDKISLEMRSLLVDIEIDSESAQQTIIRLLAERDSERDALTVAKQTIKRLHKKLRWYRDNQTFVLPSLPTIKCRVKKKLPKRSKATRRRYVPRRSISRPRSSAFKSRASSLRGLY